jgi:hypothetical protein
MLIKLTMDYCDHHLGFPIGIKNIKFVEDLPMIIPRRWIFTVLEDAILQSLCIWFDISDQGYSQNVLPTYMIYTYHYSLSFRHDIAEK